MLAIRLNAGVWVVSYFRDAVGALLSGALLPLALMPWGLGRVFAWLPFASMASAPLRIYTGTGPAVALLLGQLFWAVVLWPLAAYAWSRSRERMVSMGG